MKNNGVVIVTYNRLNLLKECIAAVFAQEYPFSELIIVNNASTDGTEGYLNGLKDTDTIHLTMIHSKENLGGSGGFYLAMEEAQKRRWDYILIIDDDAILRPDYMRRLMAYAEAHPSEDTEALAGAVMVDGRLDITHRRRVGNKLIFTEPPVDASNYSKEAFCCDTATFCGLVIRGEVFRRIGLPTREYFIWYDDTEYSLRLNGITVIPAARLDHKTKPAPPSAGLLERTTWRHYYGYRNRYDTAKKHFGALSAACIALEYRVLRLASRFMWLDPKRRDTAAFNIEMIHDALGDAKAGRLGRNPNYTFDRKTP